MRLYQAKYKAGRICAAARRRIALCVNKQPVMYGGRHAQRFAILGCTRQSGMIAFRQFLGGKKRTGVLAQMGLAEK
jgi:hypothetical protein